MKNEGEKRRHKNEERTEGEEGKEADKGREGARIEGFIIVWNGYFTLNEKEQEKME